MKLLPFGLFLPVFSLAIFSELQAQNFSVTNLSRTAGIVSLQWSSAGSGLAYTVQGRDRLNDGVWLTLSSNQPWPLAQTQLLATNETNAAKFFRVLAVPTAERGKVLASTPTASYSTGTLNGLFSYHGIPVTAAYSVNCYRLIYETIDPVGGRKLASGELVLPVGVGQPLPVFSYQHGTTTATNDAPSGAFADELLVGLVFASTGYASTLADYLGLGSGPGLHPYLHARSEATACVDMLRAARRFCASNSIPLNSQLFLAGYSQGGHATMALHRELEAFHTNEFSITASAPMAGPYDMSGVTAADVLSGRQPPNPYYMAYVLAAYQDVYHLGTSFADLLTTPYNTTLPPLFNGNYNGSEINNVMPADPLQILKPEQTDAFRNNPNSPLRVALRDNDVYQWKPVAPMRMYHCSADQDVIYANSQVALTNFQARGASQVQLFDPSPASDHGDCFLPSLSAAKIWFDSLKQ